MNHEEAPPTIAVAAPPREGEASARRTSHSNTEDTVIEAEKSAEGSGEFEKRADEQKTIAPPPYPDGGLRAWSVVLGAWCISFVSWGFVSSFGVFQDHYQVHQLANRSPSAISWIGSFQISMVLGCAIVSGRAFDQGYLHYVLAGGTLIYAAGLLGLSWAHTYAEIFLSHGAAVGIAAGILFLPAASCISHWFQLKRATALGVFATGSSLGGVIYPIMLNKMFTSSLGFGWTVRITAFLSLTLMGIANLTLRSRLPPRKGGRLIDFGVFKDPLLAVFALGASLCMLGLYTPFFYMQFYALQNGVDENIAFYSLSILNAASLFGRLIPNYLADTYGPLTILIPNILIAGVFIFLWLPMGKKEAPLIVFSIIFGFASGAYVSMMPACVASLTDDMSQMGLRLAMMFLIVSLFALAGPPIAGALVTHQNGSFVGAAVFAGSVVIAGAALIAVARQMAVRRKGTQRV